MNELCARLLIAAPDAADGRFMYLPGGVQEIACSIFKTDIAVKTKVLVNPASADALNRQYAALAAKTGQKPYFDFNHEDGAASFWPSQFVWSESPKPGVYVEGEWSDDGKAAIAGKRYRGFSPVWWVDDPNKNPSIVICNPNAKLNMGGLVNDPAFRENLPLWAKHSEQSETNEPNTDITMKQTLAELQAKLATLATEITELKAKAGTDATAAAQLSAKESQLELTREKVKTAELEAKIGEHNTALGKAAIQSAIKRGVPGLAQNTELQAKYQRLVEQDPSNVALIEALAGDSSLTAQVTTGAAPHSLQAKEGPARIVKAYGELAAKNAKIPFDHATARAKGNLGREMAALFASEISGANFKKFAGMPLMGADNNDANLGTLTGTLVAQQTLELFHLEFGGLFQRISTDFSDIPAEFGQTTKTRIVTVPTIATYNSGLDATNRVIGWLPASAPGTVDVPVTLDEHIGVPITFDSNMLASTMRNLFAEQAPGASYAIAKYFVEKLFKVFTLANYNAYAAVNGQKVPVAYASYKVGLNAIARSTCTALAAIFNPNEVPIPNRTLLLNSPAHAALANDPSLVTFFSGQRAPEIITDNELPKLGTFMPIEAPNLTNGNVTPNMIGMALHKAGAIIKARLSNDYTTILPGANYGSVTTMMSSTGGPAMMLVQYLNHDGGTANWRLQAMIGAAPGDKRGGLVIQSQ